MRRLLSAAVFLCVFPIAATAAEPQKLDCSTFPADSSHASLVKSLGADNVTTETVAGSAGQNAPTTVIYAKDKTKRAIVFWKDDAAKKGIAAILVRKDDKSDATGWTAGGLTIASTLADVEKANGQPFEIAGFGGDFGGYTGDWEEGKLDSILGQNCHLSLRFSLPAGVKPDVAKKVTGGDQFPSDGAEIVAAKPVISEITVEFPE
ncbi:MAG: hypothetical protein P4L98_13450 [Ancalomicrobiaceae bacterium]|nr:hypothetical protein [Ancalomicrobiaceae bacterium]